MRIVRGGDSGVWVMDRDEQMFEWFSIVRVTNVETIRWVLGALNGWEVPVSVRRAQSWCARMEQAGMIGRTRIGSGTVVWATFGAVGRTKPDVFRQTTRHEVAVSTASARYAAAGYAWQRDERAQQSGMHQADGVALAVEWAELIEVELTGKRPARYVDIFRGLRDRLDEADKVTYLCTPDAGRAVRTALASSREGLAVERRVQVWDVFDRFGSWAGEQLPDWLVPAAQRVAADAAGPVDS